MHVELQHNGYDCGLYMLQYIEKIAKEMPDLACKKRRGAERSVRWEDGGPKLHFTENTIERRCVPTWCARSTTRARRRRRSSGG